ncbi:MAG: hypothetical protein ACRC92_27500 [Peptostreptococcaceae bacterium]
MRIPMSLVFKIYILYRMLTYISILFKIEKTGKIDYNLQMMLVDTFIGIITIAVLILEQLSVHS